MQFISLAKLRTFTDPIGDISTLSGRSLLLENIDKIEIPDKYSAYSRSDLIQFISGLTDKQLVFYQWIDHNPNLVKLLEGNKPDAHFTDNYHWIGHALESEFSLFLKPYLITAALKYKVVNDYTLLYKVFSYLILLPKDDRLFVEQELFKGLKNDIESGIKKAAEARDENALLIVTEAICNDAITGIVTKLSRSSYHLKIWYIDQILGLLKLNSCTPRLIYRIVQKLKVIDLNPEHRELILSIEKDLKSGQFSNKLQSSSFFKKLNFKSLLSVSLLILIGLAVIYVFNYRQEKNNKDDLKQVSSFEQFSKEERRQLDSLIRSKRQAEPDEESQQDQYLWTQGSGVSLALRKPLSNQQMDKLYSDWLLDADLHENGYIDSCSGSKSKREFIFTGNRKISELQGSHKTIIRNESVYSVYLFVFDNKPNGKIYSAIIDSGKDITIKMDKNQCLLFAAGKNLSGFDVPQGVKLEELPSENFTHHFCEADRNLSISLNTLYKLSYPAKGRNKILLSGDDVNIFTVADLYGILEEL